jgi:hypothetical protein
LSFGPKQIVIKKGEHGAMLFEDGEFFTVPAFPVEKVIDPTALETPLLEGSQDIYLKLNKLISRA